MAKEPVRIYQRLGSQIPATQWVGSGSGISGTFGVGKSSFTESWLIADNGGFQLQTFIQDVLGFAVREPNGGRAGFSGNPQGAARTGLISRKLPARTVEISYLWASSVTAVEGLASTGGAGASQRATWKQYKVTIQYETPPYDVRADGVGGGDLSDQEWKRFVWIEAVPSVEFIQRNIGSFKFPSVAQGAPAGIANTAIPQAGGAVVLMSKTTYIFHWIGVPDIGLYGNAGFTGGGTAVNIENALGKVNNATWHGWPRGTVLFESWKPHQRTYPVDPSVIGQFGGEGIIPRAWDVDLTFTYFNPEPIGVTAPAEIRGHNLVPSAFNNKWYRAILNAGTPADTEDFWRYRETNFDTIFKMHYT